MTTQLLYTLDEAGEQLRICKSGVYGLIDSGQLKSIKIGRRRLIAAADLVNLVESMRATA